MYCTAGHKLWLQFFIGAVHNKIFGTTMPLEQNVFFSIFEKLAMKKRMNNKLIFAQEMNQNDKFWLQKDW